QLDAYRNTRQPGSRYAHRATDYPAGSSSPMKLVNPPVALMFHEGARRVLASGAHVPALHDGDAKRVALEAYPGLLVRKQLGIRESYELLSRIGPGTPMGDLLRQYWQPAVLSSKLPERDGPPLRVRLLGEDLIAFRDTNGR